MMSAASTWMGRKFAKLMWCNPRQPRFASVFCVSVKDPGALVIIRKGEKSEGLPVLQCNVSEILSNTIVHF